MEFHMECQEHGNGGLRGMSGEIPMGEDNMMPIEAISVDWEVESFQHQREMTQQCRQNLETWETNAIAHLERHHPTREACQRPKQLNVSFGGWFYIGRQGLRNAHQQKYLGLT